MSVHLELRKSAGLRLCRSAVQVLTSIVLKRIRKIVLFLTSRSVTMSPKSLVLHLTSRSAPLPILNNARLHMNSNVTRYTRRNAPLLTNMNVQLRMRRNAKQHTKKNVHTAVVRKPQRNIAIRFLEKRATRFLGKLVTRSPSSLVNRSQRSIAIKFLKNVATRFPSRAVRKFPGKVVILNQGRIATTSHLKLVSSCPRTTALMFLSISVVILSNRIVSRFISPSAKAFLRRRVRKFLFRSKCLRKCVLVVMVAFSRLNIIDLFIKKK